MNNNVKILAIESSCDEMAASIITEVGGKPTILSNIISSQADLHAKTGGVVPEVASRTHMESAMPVLAEALLIQSAESIAKNMSQENSNYQISTINYQQAIESLNDITHIAVTAGPGLVGSLLVGYNVAKTLAYALNLPIIPINHIEGHIYSTISNTKQELKNKSNNDGLFPVLALTVSGGHTSLTLVRDHLDYQPIGQTIDDAAGEAFDKVAKLLGLGYPGGPAVSHLANEYRNLRNNTSSPIIFPRPIINDGTFNFSFSGLKTAVLTKVKEITGDGHILTDKEKEEISYAFEEAVVDVLATKTIRAALKYRPKGIILAGGVSANRRLQEELKDRIERYNGEITEEDRMNFYLPPKDLMGDNAAMIGLAAYFHIKNGDIHSWSDMTLDSNLKLPHTSQS